MPVKPNKIPFTPEELRELLDYDPETGIFTWKVKVRSQTVIGEEAGGLSGKGYGRIQIKGVRYYTHRLAWYYHYGVEPKEQIDHVNGVKGDNRLSNLREATNAENNRNQGKQSNNTSGFKGVSLKKSTKKFVAECWVNGKKHFLGSYDTAELAHEAYKAFAKEHHGDFARTE